MNRIEHLLTILAEEAVEVAQRATKALRFGLAEVEPGQPITNAGRLRAELWDLIAAVEMLAEHDRLIDAFADFPVARRQAVEAKKAKVESFLKYSRALGTLQDAAPVTNESKES